MDYLPSLRSVVGYMIDKENMSQIDINNVVKNILIEKSNNETYDILYNDISYGGYFGYTDDFISYLKIKQVPADHRTSFVPLILEYGTYMSVKYPNIATIVDIYLTYDIAFHRSIVTFLKFYANALKTVERNLMNVMATIDKRRPPRSATTPMAAAAATIDNFDYESYSLEDLILAKNNLEEERSTILEKIQLKQHDINIPSDIFKKMYEFKYPTHFKPLIDHNILSFNDGLKALGQHDPNIWNLQKKFDYKSMFFIHNNLALFEIKPKTTDVYFNVGLLCAGDENTCLEVKEFPKYLDYYVQCVGGKEEIKVV